MYAPAATANTRSVLRTIVLLAPFLPAESVGYKRVEGEEKGLD